MNRFLSRSCRERHELAYPRVTSALRHMCIDTQIYTHRNRHESQRHVQIVTHRHTCIYSEKQTHEHTHRNRHMYIYSHRYTCTQTHVHRHTDAYSQKHRDICTQRNTDICTDIHTHTDTDAHTEIQNLGLERQTRVRCCSPSHPWGRPLPYGSVQALREASPLFCALSGQVHLSWTLSPHGDPGPGTQPRGQRPGLGLPGIKLRSQPSIVAMTETNCSQIPGRARGSGRCPPAQGDGSCPEGVHACHRVPHLLLVAQIEVGIVDKLQGQHVSGVAPENLLPELASFWEVPGRPARVLISHGMSAQKGLIQPPWGKAMGFGSPNRSTSTSSSPVGISILS